MEKSVLLVDDKQEIAKIIMLYLSSTYKVSYKENPLKAIAWLQEGNHQKRPSEMDHHAPFHILA